MRHLNNRISYEYIEADNKETSLHHIVEVKTKPASYLI